MAARKLAAYVYVGGRLYEPGDSPEKEVADQITNPKAWGDEPEPEGEEKSAPTKKAAVKRPSTK